LCGPGPAASAGRSRTSTSSYTTGNPAHQRLFSVVSVVVFPGVLRIRILIRRRIRMIHMFLDLLDLDPDPLVRNMDPDPAPRGS
jgi:hypothetical protein